MRRSLAHWIPAVTALFLVLPDIPAFAHEVGTQHAEAEVSLSLALVLGAGANLIPLWIGTWIGLRNKDLQDRFLALLTGGAAGALLFLLLDFFNLTASLGMGLPQWGFRGLLLASMLAGLWLSSLLESRVQPRAVVTGPARTALLWAVGIGLHSLGEGVIMGYNLRQGLEVALQPLPILSFALHKVVEGATAGLLVRDRSRPALGLSLTAVAGLPGLAGILVGFAGLPGSVSNIAYALGAGALLFVLPKFLASRGDQDWIWSRSLGMGLGFLFMYLAALLHEF